MELSFLPWLSIGLAHLLLSFFSMKSDSDMGLGLWQVSGVLQIHLWTDFSVLTPVPSPDRSGNLSSGQVEPEMQDGLPGFVFSRTF